MLQFFIHQGLTTREVLKLKTADLDLQKATVNIQTTTRGKDRTIPLHVTQICFLMQYINQIRPQLAYTENEKLFFAYTTEKRKRKPRKNALSIIRQTQKTKQELQNVSTNKSFINHALDTDVRTAKSPIFSRT